MARGRNYYDPILQAPGKPPKMSERRIELYPEQDVRDNVPGGSLRWVGRLIDEGGRIADVAPGSFDHDDALRQAQERWPGLQVYELREESEDSTHEGFGPSPRLWQVQTPSGSVANLTGDEVAAITQAVAEAAPGEDQAMLHTLIVGKTGTYVRLEDLLALLETYAGQFDRENNPSAALGIREAAAALREPF